MRARGENYRLALMIHAAAKVQAAGGVRTLSFDASAPLQLSNGEKLAPLTIAFETYGALNTERSNAVLVCHGLTHDQFVASPNPITGRPAWWPRIVGPGRPIDTNRFFVICANVLGGSMGTTGPASLAPRIASRTACAFRRSRSPTWCARSRCWSKRSASRACFW